MRVFLALQINTSNEKSNIDKKPLDKSRSSYNNGSGEIDITLANTYGFRMNLENLQDVKAEIQVRCVCVQGHKLLYSEYYVIKWSLYVRTSDYVNHEKSH